ncbi:MAG: hypothetical protein AB8B54_12170, partial [Sphingorhabdus sp.]
AISTVFALAFLGSVTVIAMMFFQYRDKIMSVIQSEMKIGQSETVFQPIVYRHRVVKTKQLMTHHRSLQTVPLRAAA